MGCLWTAHLLCFGTVKNSLGFVQLGPKTSMCWVLEIDEINGLSCVEIDKLIHDSNVLTQCIIKNIYNCFCRLLEMIL